ncbi:hypothetical protein XENORESO_003024 [Xenotaenia resolanae]|uniref:Uncharacterized protein n=1 Tax=Xenotaenia resolanae TaxID=208358 RepID=A0ABV0VUH0_9TELE
MKQESEKGEKRKKIETVTVGEFMHLTGVYTPALHMCSIQSFKSSLQRDRTKHKDSHSKRHKHKIIKEPQTQLASTTYNGKGQKQYASSKPIVFFYTILPDNCAVLQLKIS